MIPAELLSIKTYSSFEASQPIRMVWDRLARDHFMLQWPWLKQWWHHFGNGEHGQQRRQLVLATVVGNDGKIYGIAPFYRDYSFTGRSLRFLGDGSVCSDYVRVLCDEINSAAVQTALGRWLASSDFRLKFGSIDWLEIAGHTEKEHSWVSLFNELVLSGWSRQSAEIQGSWAAQLPGNFQDFYANVSKSRRRKINKANRLLDDGSVSCRFLTDKHSILERWPTFVAFHQRRRATLNQVGCFANPRFEQFLNATVQDFADQSQSVLVELLHFDQPVGYLLAFRSLNQFAIYQSGFDPDFDHLEPGHLINAYAIRHAIESQAKSYDLLRGDESYKEGWGAHRTPLHVTRCTAPQISARIKNSLWSAGRQIKSLRDALTFSKPETVE